MVHFERVPSTLCPFSPTAVLTLVQPACLEPSVSIAHLLHMSLGMAASPPGKVDPARSTSTLNLPVSPRSDAIDAIVYCEAPPSKGCVLTDRIGCCSTLFFFVTLFSCAVRLNISGGIVRLPRAGQWGRAYCTFSLKNWSNVKCNRFWVHRAREKGRAGHHHQGTAGGGSKGVGEGVGHRKKWRSRILSTRPIMA